MPLVVSKVLVCGGNMRERTPSARAYFSAAAERGRVCHLYLVSKVLVRGGNMREHTPSARSEQMRHSECSDIRHSDRTFLLHFWNKLGENNNFGMSIVKKQPILNKILINQIFVSEA